jgi:hypothetical protein
LEIIGLWKMRFKRLTGLEALEELITHLRNLITIYTTNPSGNEIAAAR